MADVFSINKRSEVMSRIRSCGNKATELALVRLFRKGRISGWRRHWPLLGRPDFVFRASRLAIFVDGCFWHGCRKHSRPPQSNKNYWRKKMVRNKARDRAVSRALRRNGWQVLRIWEHDLRRPDNSIRRIQHALGRVPHGIPGLAFRG